MTSTTWCGASANSARTTAPASSRRSTASPPSATARATSSASPAASGRAVFGTIDIIRDVVESGAKHPAARPAGRGQDDHAARGGPGARRRARQAGDHRRHLQRDRRRRRHPPSRPSAARGACRCRTPAEQHAVMIEAVENHMPEVIVIDEIGTEAGGAGGPHHRRARRAARRHGPRQHAGKPADEPDAFRPRRRHPGGHALRRGGPQARHAEDGAGAQGPAHLRRRHRDQDRDKLAVHHDVASTVDRWLRGQTPRPEIRYSHAVASEIEATTSAGVGRSGLRT